MLLLNAKVLKKTKLPNILEQHLIIYWIYQLIPGEDRRGLCRKEAINSYKITYTLSYSKLRVNSLFVVLVFFVMKNIPVCSINPHSRIRVLLPMFRIEFTLIS